MPIYEFRCTKCGHVFEILVKAGEENVEMACPACKSEEFERIMSCTNFAVSGGGGKPGPSATTRTCSGGSCTSWDIPGPK